MFRLEGMSLHTVPPRLRDRKTMMLEQMPTTIPVRWRTILRIPMAVAWLAAVMATAAPSVRLAAQAGPPEIPEPGETLYEIELTDGSLLYARITSVSADVIVLTTEGGSRVEVDPAQIRRLGPARGEVVEGEFWKEDPSGTRLFFTSTGRALRQGEAYVGTYLVVLPFAAVGITDRITIGAGAPVLFGEFEPFYVAPKIQILNASRVQVSAGALAFIFDSEVVGIAYGVGTFGTPDRALTAGLGFGFSGDDFESEPVGMVGGEVRVSRRVKLLTENYFLPSETGAALSGGIRFFGDRFAADVGVAGVVGGNEAFCCIPLLNVSYAFGSGW